VEAPRDPMRIVIAQIRVERELARNTETICSVLRRARPRDWVVFPEGALTGYFPDETDYLAAIGPSDVEDALQGLQAVVARQGCHCVVGTARFVADGWRNSAVLISPASEVRWYDKNTLSALDSQHFVAGDQLCVYEIDGVKAGVQICWELLFPPAVDTAGARRRPGCLPRI
jgi:predicted amidohydrolase